MEIVRKLQDVHQHLTTLAEQGKVEGFFNNVENADKLRGLVEDIRDAIIDHQVHTRKLSISSFSDVRARLHCSKISTTRVASSL